MPTSQHPSEEAEWLRKLCKRLRELDTSIDAGELFPTVVPEAGEFVAANPYAFCIATCLDRGTRAEVIWTIPFDLSQALGHLDPFLIDKMDLAEVEAVFARLPRKPRYVNAAPRTVKELTNKIVHEFGGDAAAVWRDANAEKVHRFFNSIYGVGPGIASMAVLLIEKGFGVRFGDAERPAMDIKPDVHTMRVLYRLGAAEVQSTELAVRAARRICPDFPGGIDGVLWRIGQTRCHAAAPDCPNCRLEGLCRKVGV
ncbi:MAG: hypothetical protein M1389_05500 [Chloroflexi bacterium]|nr:hypothetical protein [Chloroflexota bacterium]